MNEEERIWPEDAQINISEEEEEDDEDEDRSNTDTETEGDLMSISSDHGARTEDGISSVGFTEAETAQEEERGVVSVSTTLPHTEIRTTAAEAEPVQNIEAENLNSNAVGSAMEHGEVDPVSFGAAALNPATLTAVDAARLDYEDQTQATQLTEAESPHAYPPCTAAAGGGGVKNKEEVGSLDLHLPSSSGMASPGFQTRRGRSGPGTAQAATVAATTSPVSSESSAGVSQLRMASPSVTSSPDGNIDRHSSTPRRRPSPPRRSGQGSGVFLAQATVQVAPVLASVEAEAATATAAESTASSRPSMSQAPSSPFSTAAHVSLPGVTTASAGGESGVMEEVGQAAVLSGGGGCNATSETRAKSNDGKSRQSDSPGFLSSAEASVKGASAPGGGGGGGATCRSLSSPALLPVGWLEGQLAASGVERKSPSAGTREREVGVVLQGRQRVNEASGPPGSKPTSDGKVANPSPLRATTTLAERPLLEKAKPGSDGWIQRRRTSRGGASAGGANGGGYAVGGSTEDGNLSTQEGSTSPTILALGVPPNRKEPLRPSRQLTAAAAAHSSVSQCCGRYDDVQGSVLMVDEQGSEEQEEEVNGTPAASGPLPNTQDMLARDMSQEGILLSQNAKATDLIIAQALRYADSDSGQEEEEGSDKDEENADGDKDEAPSHYSQRSLYRLSGTGGVPALLSKAGRSSLKTRDQAGGNVLPRNAGGVKEPRTESDVAGSGGPSNRRKKMKASAPSPPPAWRQATLSMGMAHRAAAQSTPGAYMVGSGTSAKKRRAPGSSPQPARIPPAAAVAADASEDDVFAFPGVDEDESSDDGRLGLKTPRGKGKDRFRPSPKKDKPGAAVDRGSKRGTNGKTIPTNGGHNVNEEEGGGKKSSPCNIASPLCGGGGGGDPAVTPRGKSVGAIQRQLATSRRLRDNAGATTDRGGVSSPCRKKAKTDASHSATAGTQGVPVGYGDAQYGGQGMDTVDRGDGGGGGGGEAGGGSGGGDAGDDENSDEEYSDTDGVVGVKTMADINMEKAMLAIRKDHLTPKSDRTDGSTHDDEEDGDESDESDDVVPSNAAPAVDGDSDVESNADEPIDNIKAPSQVHAPEVNAASAVAAVVATREVKGTEGGSTPASSSSGAIRVTTKTSCAFERKVCLLGDDRRRASVTAAAASGGDGGIGSVGGDGRLPEKKKYREEEDEKENEWEEGKEVENEQQGEEEAWPVEFKYLWPFLQDEGWTISRGKGLDAWTYEQPRLPPHPLSDVNGDDDTNAKPLSWVRGQDYFASEEDVVAFALRPQNADLLEKFQKCGKRYLKTNTQRSSRSARSRSVTSASKATHKASASTRGGRTSGGKAGRKTVKNRSNPRRRATPSGPTADSGGARVRRSPPARDQVSSRAHSALPNHHNDQSGVNEPEKCQSWRSRWAEAQDKMAEEGWKTVAGTGIVNWVYLKNGVTKANGVLGKNMFESSGAVIEHFFGTAAATTPGSHRDVVWEEWNLTKHKAKRRRVAPAFLRPTSRHREDSESEAGSDVEGAVRAGRGVGRARVNPAPCVEGEGNGEGSPFIPQSVDVTDDPGQCTPECTPQESESRAATRAVVTQPGSRKIAASSVSMLATGGGRHEGRGRGGEGRGESGRGRESGAHRGHGCPRKIHLGARHERSPSRCVQGCEEPSSPAEDARDAVDGEDFDCSTQPQHELASAMMMADVGRGAAAEGEAEAVAAAGSLTRAEPSTRCESPGGRASTARAALEALATVASANGTGAACSVNNSNGGECTSSRRDQALVAFPPNPTHDTGGASVVDLVRTTFTETHDRSTLLIEREASVATAARVVCTRLPAVANGDSGDSTPSRRDRKRVTSPPSSARRVAGVRGSPPSAGNASRASARIVGSQPLQGVGIIVTGCRDRAGKSKREDVIARATGLGGIIINFSGGGGPSDWRRFFPSGGNSGSTAAAGGQGGQEDSRRVIAVATPDSLRTSKYLVAVAAGVEIVHPLYLTYCEAMKRAEPTAGCLLPLGRSALRDRGLVMPTRLISVDRGRGNSSSRGTGSDASHGTRRYGDDVDNLLFSDDDVDVPIPRMRPFEGKRVLLYLAGSSGAQPPAPGWTHILGVSGAKVTAMWADGAKVVIEADGRRGKGDRAASGREGGREAFLEAVLGLLGRGGFHYLIGPATDGPGAHGAAGKVKAQLLTAAGAGGVPAATLEWAAQCLVHGRELSFDATACPWFPLELGQRSNDGDRSGGGGGEGEVGGASGETRNGRKRRRNRAHSEGGMKASAAAAATAGGNTSSASESKVKFFVHCTPEGKRYVSGDYVVLLSDAHGGRAAAGAAASPRRVARVLSFERGQDGKVDALVTVMDVDGQCLERPELDEGEEVHRVTPNRLGSCVLVMGEQEINKTRDYALHDPSVFRLKDE